MHATFLISQADLSPRHPLLLLTAGMLAIGLLTASLLLWGLILRRLRRREPILEKVERPDWPLSPSIAWVALLIWGGAQVAIPPLFAKAPKGEEERGAVRLEMVQASVVTQAATLAGLFGVLALSTSRFEALGLSFRNWLRQISLGVVVFAASVLPVLLTALAMTPLRTEETQHKLLQFLHANPTLESFAWIALSAAICAPLVEELLFRVLLQGTLQALIPAGWAIFAVAIFFCLVHGWRDAIPLFPLALVLGYAYRQTNSYLVVVVAHGCFNACNLMLAILVQVAT